jgi:NAD(P)-dependent dehydrogenase (short-subunit alcohol dehydrogenase family)
MGALSGQVCLIQGASQGIGKAIAQAFAGDGARLVITARSTETLEQLAGKLRETGAEVTPLTCDVSNETDVDRCFGWISEKLGRLDVMVQCAGVAKFSRLADFRTEDFDQMVEVNLRGAFLCYRGAFRLMIPQGGGRIIAINSAAAKRSNYNAAGYGASKFGLTGLTEVAAIEGREHGIVVSEIFPGPTLVDKYVANPPPDAHERMQPGDVAEVVRLMATLPRTVNLWDVTIFPASKKLLGREEGPWAASTIRSS